MKVFVVTNDNYFYIGLKESLANRGLFFIKLKPSALNIEQLKASTSYNTFIFYKTDRCLVLSLFITPTIFLGRLVFIQERGSVSIRHIIGKHTLLNAKANAEELFSAITIKMCKDRMKRDIPSQLTERESMILGYTLNGMNADAISRFLRISRKTVYAHRRNGFIKLGGRNIFEIWPVR